MADAEDPRAKQRRDSGSKEGHEEKRHQVQPGVIVKSAHTEASSMTPAPKRHGQKKKQNQKKGQNMQQRKYFSTHNTERADTGASDADTDQDEIDRLHNSEKEHTHSGAALKRRSRSTAGSTKLTHSDANATPPTTKRGASASNTRPYDGLMSEEKDKKNHNIQQDACDIDGDSPRPAASAADETLPSSSTEGSNSGTSASFSGSQSEAKSTDAHHLSSEKSRPVNRTRQKSAFPHHWDEKDANSCLRGAFRAHPGRRKIGYCSVRGLRYDILLEKEKALNRAIHGDIVHVELSEPSAWPRVFGEADETEAEVNYSAETQKEEAPVSPDMPSISPSGSPEIGNAATAADWTLASSSLLFHTSIEQSMESLLERADLLAQQNRRPVGRVVRIHQKSRSRECIIGFVKKQAGGSLLFKPREERYPFMKVDSYTLHKNHEAQRLLTLSDSSLGRVLFSVRIKNWSATNDIPLCEVTGVLGKSGDFDVEKAAIREEFTLPSPSFPEHVLEDVEQTVNGPLDEDELMLREEVTGFTIDPATAKDLDDALSVSRVCEELLKVQVSIADVSFYVREGTQLDQEARRRAQSVYFMRDIIRMLPPELSENMCSLNAGRPSYTFTFEFTMDEETTKVVEERFFKSTFTSQAQLSYEQAQAIIDADKNVENQFPTSVVQQIKLLHTFAQRRSSIRFTTGSLQLDNPKLSFEVDENGYPAAFSVEKGLQANALVQEMMLLANARVARKIASHFVDEKRALLRRHPPPDTRKFEFLQRYCAEHEIETDTTSSLALHQSLKTLEERNARLFEVIRLSVTKPMQLAHYFCIQDHDDYSHYGLGFPCYTHATSPIRRYADVIVHRLLAEACNISKDCWSSEGAQAISDLANLLNDKKLAAKSAEESGRRFFLRHILSNRAIAVDCTVVRPGQRNMQVYVRDIGESIRLALPTALFASDDPHDPLLLAEEDDNNTYVTLRWRDAEPPALLNATPEQLCKRGAELCRAYRLAESEGIPPLQLPVTLCAYDALPCLLHAVFPEEKQAEMFICPMLQLQQQ